MVAIDGSIKSPQPTLSMCMAGCQLGDQQSRQKIAAPHQICVKIQWCQQDRGENYCIDLFDSSNLLNCILVYIIYK